MKIPWLIKNNGTNTFFFSQGDPNKILLSMEALTTKVLGAKTCRGKYKFKIHCVENVTQLLEFHALSDHQTVLLEIVEL